MKMILIATILVMTSAVYAFGQCSDADTKALEAFDRAWGEANDRATLEPFYADDFRGIGMLGTTTKEQALENIAPADPNMTYDNYIITCTPNTATITHRFVVKSKENGKEKTDYGRAIHFLEKRSGKWKVVSSTGHPMNNETHILGVEMDLGPAFVKRDVAWFERHVADDYIGSNFDGKMENKMQLIERVKNHKYSYDLPINMSNVNIRMNGNSATIMGVYNLTGKDEQGNSMKRTMRFSRMYVKKDGEWMIVADQDYLVETPQ